MTDLIFSISVEKLAQRENVINCDHASLQDICPGPKDLSCFLECSKKDRTLAVFVFYMLCLVTVDWNRRGCLFLARPIILFLLRIL